MSEIAPVEPREQPGDEEESYALFVEECAKVCRCCFECATDRPCAGVMAGGSCDAMCSCNQYDDSPELELGDDNEESNDG